MFDSGHSFMRQSTEVFLPEFSAHFLRVRGLRVLRSMSPFVWSPKEYKKLYSYWKMTSVTFFLF